MNSLTHFSQMATDFMKNYFNTYSNVLLNSFSNPFSIDSYEEFVINLDTFTTSLSQDAYTSFLASIDNEFFNSSERRRSYESKGFTEKRLLTKFGFIVFRRRRYKHKVTGELLTFLDEYLGLPKYSRFDPFVIAELCEESATTSYARAGRIVSKEIGSKIKFDDNPNKYMISRATTRNVVVKATKFINEPESDSYREVEVLNIMLDEKFVGSQFNEGKDFMVKAVVLYEGMTTEYKNRVRLTGKKVFGSVDDDKSLLESVVDYIYYTYDTDKLKYINFMGDGANWIHGFATNSIFKYNKDMTTKFLLDHFHVAQAVQTITTNKYREDYAKDLMKKLRKGDLDGFKEICNKIIDLNLHRVEKIKEKMEYISKNWTSVQNMFKEANYKCSMESNISHVFADIFTARPKAFSLKGLRALLKIRLLKINGYDLKRLYFCGLKETEKEEKTSKTIDKVKVSPNVKYDDINFELPILHSSSYTTKTIRAIIA